MGPKVPRSTVLSADEETLIVAFRRHKLLPLDDCLYALQATIPHLTRSSLHRLFKRHGTSRLPSVESLPPRRQFRAYPLGYLHIDLTEVWSEEGKLYLFVAIDRVSKFAFAELHEQATRRVAADFLRRLVERVPYRIHTVLTDNGFQFTPPEGGWSAGEIQQLLTAGQPFRAHAFGLACAQLGIDHRLTKFNHPWTNGQVERMNRTIKDATVRPSPGASSASEA
jgi:transposase InsO family protein